VFIKPHILELSQDELIQIIKPLYGLADSGDYWGETLTEHHLEDLRMQQANGDFSLYFHNVGKKLTGMSRTYVDDILRTGNEDFKRSSMAATYSKFDAKDPIFNDFTFTGIHLSGTKEYRKLSQERYILRLSRLAREATYEQFRSCRHKLAWTVHTRPDIAFAVSKLAQVTAENFDHSAIRNYNKLLKHLHSTKGIVLEYPKLDVETLRPKVYSDSSFADNDDCSSQLGHIIVLADASNQFAVLHFMSHKSKRVTRSSMAAETLSFAHEFDYASLLKHDLERILHTRIPILMLMDSQALFDVLTRAKYTTEKRLMIDIAAACQAYNNRMIDNIALIRSEYNPADALTKIGPNEALRKLLVSHQVSHPVEQYVIDPLIKKT